MIVLHATWSGGGVHLFAEDSRRLEPGAQTRTREESHPFTLTSAELQQVLQRAGWAFIEDSSIAMDERLFLPSLDDAPIGSPELYAAGNGAGEHPRSPTGTLRAWRVEGMFLPSRCLGELAATAATCEHDEFVCGQSLLFWQRFARLAIRMLARQRFVPDIREAGVGRFDAHWRTLVDSPDDGALIEQLAEGMPPVCFAAAAAGNTIRKRQLVEDALERTMDAMIRRFLADEPMAMEEYDDEEDKEADPPSVEMLWLQGLFRRDGQLGLGEAEASATMQKVRSWVGRLPDVRRGTTWQTCFRLIAPGEAHNPIDESEPLRPDAPNWLLEFHLEASDDPSVILEPDAIWATQANGQQRRGGESDPAEKLLMDLSSATRVFPPLGQCLQEETPVACRLDTMEAYAFLSESTEALERLGFIVRLPSWWRLPSAAIGMRLEVEAPESPANEPSMLGLGNLVHYRWQAAIGDHQLTREELEALADRKLPLVHIRNQWVAVQPEKLKAASQLLDEKREGTMTLLEALRLGLAGEDSRTGLAITGIDTQGWLDRFLRGDGSGSQYEQLDSPEGFEGTLRPYQLRGVSWLAFLDRLNLGACLADDMGLGKTIEFIALLLHERKNNAAPGPTLLVVPMSVVGNWQRELQRFGPQLTVMVHHGSERLSGDAFKEQAQAHDVVISTYALAYRDHAHLEVVKWHRLALDEAQNIKNPVAKQTRAIRSIPAVHRVALTGTPLENHLTELWSIMDFLNPGYLGNATEFRRDFAVPIEKHAREERAERLRRLIKPFVLRRTKKDPEIAADLPDQMEMKVFTNLTREQASLYEAVVQDMLGKIDASSGMQRRGLVLATLVRLKQVCNHPAHFLRERTPLAGRSGKCDRLGDMLEEVIAEGDKALVFTQFAQMGHLLVNYLNERLDIDIPFMHGGIGRTQREAMVDRFQGGNGQAPVFVLSLKTGGVGMNLTAANHVFHFDRWWNPAVENQATDRVHRIGQTKNVQVHKFVCVGTMEERIDAMIEQKKSLAQNIIGSGEQWLTELTTKELREVFALSLDAVAED